jgi:hypothetical protein
VRFYIQLANIYYVNTDSINCTRGFGTYSPRGASDVNSATRFLHGLLYGLRQIRVPYTWYSQLNTKNHANRSSLDDTKAQTVDMNWSSVRIYFIIQRCMILIWSRPTCLATFISRAYIIACLAWPTISPARGGYTLFTFARTGHKLLPAAHVWAMRRR